MFNPLIQTRHVSHKEVILKVNKKVYFRVLINFLMIFKRVIDLTRSGHRDPHVCVCFFLLFFFLFVTCVE